MNDQETSNSRIFCLTLIYGLGTLMGAALAAPAAIYLLLPPRTRKESLWVNAVDLGQLDPKNPQEVIFRRNSSAPLLGRYLTRLLGSDGRIGVVTFARFYAMHVLLLPPATTLLIAWHIYLVRRHGWRPSPATPAPRRSFFRSRL